MHKVSTTKKGASTWRFRGYCYTDRVEKVSDFGQFTPPDVSYRLNTPRRSDLGFALVLGILKIEIRRT